MFFAMVTIFAKITVSLMENVFRGGTNMENGIYNRKEIRIVMYDKDDGNPFVVVNNDGFADQPIVLIGEDATRLIHSIADCLDA